MVLPQLTRLTGQARTGFIYLCEYTIWVLRRHHVVPQSPFDACQSFVQGFGLRSLSSRDLSTQSMAQSIYLRCQHIFSGGFGLKRSAARHHRTPPVRLSRGSRFSWCNWHA